MGAQGMLRVIRISPPGSRKPPKSELSFVKGYILQGRLGE